jgi:hypothetical protein
MPRITREPVVAYAHCAMQVDDDGTPTFDNSGGPAGLDRCPGYRQVEVAAIREVCAWTYGDANPGSSDPFDQAIAANTERSVERVLWADDADRPCPFCGLPRELSEQVRPAYANIGGPRGGPDQLFRDRRLAREQGAAAVKSADAAERQALALERANELEERRVAAMEEANWIAARQLEAREPVRRRAKVQNRERRVGAADR